MYGKSLGKFRDVLSNNWPIIHMIITTQITIWPLVIFPNNNIQSIARFLRQPTLYNNQENGHSSPFLDNFLGKKNMNFHICLCVDPQAMIPQTSHEVPVACSFFGRLHLAQGDAPRSEEQNL